MGRTNVLVKRLALGAFVMSAILGWSVELPPEARYAVQLGSFSSQPEAENCRVALTKRGLETLWCHERNGRYCVLFGSFEKGAESQVWRSHLRNSGIASDAFVVTVPAVESPIATSSLPSVFQTNGLSAAQMTLPSMKGIPEYERLQALDEPGKEAIYREALMEAIPSCAMDDPMRGYIFANLGVLDIKAGKEHYPSAHRFLQVVADGRIPASASVRTMAMVRSAWLLHQLGERERALCAWREIQAFTTSESVKARCLAEEIGLLMELAESGKGTHEEVRQAVSKALQDLPFEQIKWRAVVELIGTETYARQPNPDPARSALLCEEFVVKYAHFNADKMLEREIGSATYQAGLFHEWAGQTEEALTWYGRTLERVPSSTAAFAGHHPHAEALGGLARIAANSEDTETRDEIIREILRNHSDSEIARKMARQWPAIAAEMEIRGSEMKK